MKVLRASSAAPTHTLTRRPGSTAGPAHPMPHGVRPSGRLWLTMVLKSRAFPDTELPGRPIGRGPARQHRHGTHSPSAHPCSQWVANPARQTACHRTPAGPHDDGHRQTEAAGQAVNGPPPELTDTEKVTGSILVSPTSITAGPKPGSAPEAPGIGADCRRARRMAAREARRTSASS